MPFFCCEFFLTWAFQNTPLVHMLLQAHKNQYTHTQVSST